MISFDLFATPIGVCALVWQGERFVGAQLPEGDAGQAGRRVLRRFPGAVAAPPPLPAFVAEAQRRIGLLLAGEPESLADLPIALDGAPDFNRRVYEVALSIPPGETLTYGAVAQRIGQPGAARAVGVALGQNPLPIIVPCHRVLAAQGGAGGFSAEGGVATKLRLLTIEKARSGGQPGLFDALPFAARRD